MNNSLYLECMDQINPSRIVPMLEHGIEAETINLEAHKVLGDEMACMDIKHRIADAKIMLLILTGELRP